MTRPRSRTRRIIIIYSKTIKDDVPIAYITFAGARGNTSSNPKMLIKSDKKHATPTDNIIAFHIPGNGSTFQTCHPIYTIHKKGSRINNNAQKTFILEYNKLII